MAGKAVKKQAHGNVRILRQLYQVTGIILLLSIGRQYLGHSLSLVKLFILHIPVTISIYVLEKSGRPKFDSNDKKKIISEGSISLSDPQGLSEYLFDFVYLTWFSDLGIILFNSFKIWYIWWLCPVYIAFKLYSLKNTFLPSGMMNMKYNNKPNTINQNETASKSKRQLKREKKGDNNIKYKYK